MMNPPSDNGISSEQNSDRQLLRLAAASAVYARGKQILGLQAALTVLGGFASPIVVASLPQYKVWAAFYAFTVALLDSLVLERLQSEQRQMGARIQELFDCDLFRLPWRRLVVGEKPTPEVVTEESSKYKQRHKDLSRLRDWYPSAVSRLPLGLARLVCQRANAWWDATLRKRYCTGLKLLLGALIIFVSAFGIHRGMTMDVFVLTVVAPLTPAILWGAREIRKNYGAAEVRSKLQTHIDGLWNDALKGSLTDSVLDEESILIQNQIFHSRAKDPFVFNWVYRILLGAKEETMQQVSRQLVEQALTKESVTRTRA
jgi:hypothetical protein